MEISKTKQKLLDAACSLFAEKGYKGTTIADVCKKADANIASVNYHFKDKSSLYSEAWFFAFNQLISKYPDNTDDDSSKQPSEKLYEYIYIFLKRITVQGKESRFLRMHSIEAICPTGLVTDEWEKIRTEFRTKLHLLIKGIANKKINEEILNMCELAIVGQCRNLMPINKTDLSYFNNKTINDAFLHKIAKYITDFSIAGIQKITLSI